jgi:hypothetical protein
MRGCKDLIMAWSSETSSAEVLRGGRQPFVRGVGVNHSALWRPSRSQPQQVRPDGSAAVSLALRCADPRTSPADRNK